MRGYQLPVFTRRAKRAVTAQPKFYLFDSGVYYHIRPKGPLDSPDKVGGMALEGLVLLRLKALGSALFSSWRSICLVGEGCIPSRNWRRSAQSSPVHRARAGLNPAPYTISWFGPPIWDPTMGASLQRRISSFQTTRAQTLENCA